MKKTLNFPFYYGWVIVAVAFLSMGIWLSMRTTFSVFLVAFLDEFHWSRASAAGVQSVSFVVYTFTAPLVGALIDRYGARKVVLPGIAVLCLGLLLSAFVRSLLHLYLIYGVLVAFGVTFISIIVYSTILSHWFLIRRGLASGIAVSGMGVGTFVLVPLTQYLINAAGWRSSFLMLGGAIFVTLFPLTAIFLRNKPAELGLCIDGITEPDDTVNRTHRKVEIVDEAWTKKDWTFASVVREKRFWAVLTYSFLIIIPVYVLLIHGVKLLVDRGFNKMDAAFMIALAGISSSIFKIFWGWLSDRIGREITFTLGAFAMALGVFALLLLEGGSPLWFVYLFVVLFGCGWGVTATTFMSVSADLFQGKSFGLIYGINEAVIGLGSALGPWLGGFVFDQTGTYRIALLIAIGTSIASCPFLWMAAPRKVRRPGRLV
ncbi:MAG TPA: MFS transporter [Syntrophorhabdaceae bacterium]|nr:MFS transporter [Syntrophorhabdaceae bacterium]